MSDNGGIGQKLVEMGVSAAKAAAQEVKTTVSEATGQITGSTIKSDTELKQIASNDEAYKSQRMGEIKKELSTQKMRRFHEVSSWGANQSIPVSKQETSGPDFSSARSVSIPQSSQPNGTPTAKKPLESVRQNAGRGEQGRNYKG
jgi:hypothetical protein